MVHIILWGSSGSDWKSFPISKQTLAPLTHPLQNFVHPSQNLVHPIFELLGPLSYYLWFICPFKDLWKWLEVISYFKMDFGTLGTSLRKFDTSNPWANGTPISLSMVHLFLWRPSGSDWRSFPTSERTLAPLVHHLQKIGTPFKKFGISFTKFGTSNSWAIGTPILLSMVRLFF